jgi:hypothetical protein
MVDPSGDSDARKSQVGGSLRVSGVMAPPCGSSRQISDPPARELRLELAVEVIDVRLSDRYSPGDFRAGKALREKDGAILRPGRHVRPAAARRSAAVGRRKPHGLPLVQHAVLAAVRAADADVGPVMPGSDPASAVHVQNPRAVGRPVRAKIEVALSRGYAHSIAAIEVARPDLVAFRARKVERDSAARRG